MDILIHNQSSPPNYGEIYGADYFQSYGHNLDSDYETLPYIRYVLHELANYLNKIISFDSHCDVGCAMGFMVERMLDLDKDSWGVDVSEYALERSPESVKARLAIGNMVVFDTDKKFDLVTCVEVIEHIEPKYTERVMKKLSKWSNKYIYFSSEENYDEPTHINVRPRHEWVALWETLGYKTIPCEFGYIPQGLLLEKLNG